MVGADFDKDFFVGVVQKVQTLGRHKPFRDVALAKTIQFRCHGWTVTPDFDRDFFVGVIKKVQTHGRHEPFRDVALDARLILRQAQDAGMTAFFYTRNLYSGSPCLRHLPNRENQLQ